MQLNVAVCGEVPKVTLIGRVQVSPAGLEADTARPTVPVRPLTAVTVIVDVPDAPARIWAGDTAPAEIAKSTKWKVMGEDVVVVVSWVAVTVTVKSVAVVALQDSVAVCGDVPKVTLVGATEHVRPAGVDGFTARLTEPEPAFAVTVSVHDPEPPTKIWLGDTAPQLTDRPLAKLNVIAAVVWLSVPSVPVTVTVKEPVVDAVQLRVAVCGEVPKVTLAGSVHVSPAGVEADTARLIVPVRPLSAVTVIVEVPELPGVMVAGDTGPAAIEKSTTTNVIVPVV